MYNILCSKIENLPNYKDNFLDFFNSRQKVTIIPWSFATELLNLDEFFKKEGKRYLKYVNALEKIGINKKNIEILDCYKDSKEDIKKKINDSDILVLTGGNPEMFYSKVVQTTECLYEIKHFKGIIIGSSAGACLQFKRYFITKKNNYYKYFAFYDGFGVLDDPFYIDVHSVNNKFYLDKLQKIANNKQKKVFAIFNDGCLIYNRKTTELKHLGKVIEYQPINEEK